MSPSGLAQLGSGSIPFNYSDFSGGLNTYDKYDLLQDNQARDLLNVQGTTAGAIIKRGGFQTLVTVTNPLTSLYSASPLFLVGGDGTAGSIIRINTQIGATTTLKTGLTTGTLWEWVHAPVVGGQGPNFGMDGTNTPQWWDGSSTVGNWTATDAGGAVPNGTYCLYHRNQVFVSGVAANPSRVYWSGIADPTAWNPANLNGSGFLDLDPSDGDAVTGLGIVGPYLLIFKPRKTWVLIDAAAAQTRQLSAQVGCTSHRSIAEAPEGTYFLSMDRVYRTNGSKLEPISDKIQPTIDGAANLIRSQASACYVGSHYLLSLNLQNVVTNDAVLDWDAKLNSWWKHQINVNDWAVREKFGTTVTVPYAAQGTTAVVSRAFQPGVFQDNGSNFTWKWSGPWQSPTFYRRRRFPTTWERKRLRQIRFSGLGQVDVSLAKADPQLNPTATLVRSDIFSNSSFNTRALAYGQGVGRAFSLVFSGTYNSYAEIDEYVLSVQDRRDQLVA